MDTNETRGKGINENRDKDINVNRNKDRKTIIITMFLVLLILSLSGCLFNGNPTGENTTSDQVDVIEIPLVENGSTKKFTDDRVFLFSIQGDVEFVDTKTSPDTLTKNIPSSIDDSSTEQDSSISGDLSTEYSHEVDTSLPVNFIIHHLPEDMIRVLDVSERVIAEAMSKWIEESELSGAGSAIAFPHMSIDFGENTYTVVFQVNFLPDETELMNDVPIITMTYHKELERFEFHRSQ